jgi:hypothetical protein
MKLFSNIYAGIDVDNNRGLIIEDNALVKNVEFEAGSSADFLARVKSFTKQIVAEMPFSLRMSQLLVVVSGNEKAEVYREAEEIIDLFDNPVGCLSSLAISRPAATKLRYFSGSCSITEVTEQL